MALLRISATKAGTWQGCPRKFYLTYVAKVRRPRSWAHFSLGLSIHNALKVWWELPSHERIPERVPERVPELVRQAWIAAGYRDQDHSDEWCDRASTMVQSYLSTQDLQSEPLSMERSLSFVTDHLIVEGRIDRLDERADSTVTVVDYKTGKTPPTDDDVRSSMALAMYALMVQRALKRECTSLALHHVPSAQVIEVDVTQEMLTRHLARLESVGQDIRRAVDTHESLDESDEEARAEIFPAVPSVLCGYCDFWDICEAGQAFTDRRDPWAALESA